MTSADGIVDWNGLSLNEGISTIGALMREHLEVRIFALDRTGEVVDLTPEETPLRTVFDHLVLGEGSWSGPEGNVSFGALREQWRGALGAVEVGGEAGEVLGTESWPGFAARIAPVRRGDEVVGAIVAAGFVAVERASQAVDQIRRVLPTHLKARIDDGDGPGLAQLQRESRRWLDRLLTTMAEKATAVLADDSEALLEHDGVRFCGMIGKSDPMLRLFRDMQKVARTNSTVLITGENGTGKELVARGVHTMSRRGERPFVAVNCAAIPPDLIASELFGHVRGAFSGAHKDRMGLFEAADGGTLLLDEIGDMDYALQTKLLRVLQEGTLVPVGDSEVRRVDVRVICATNRDLETMVRRGEFRQDLFFRIRVIQVKIPALRERGEDVTVLSQHFLSAASRRHGMVKKTLSQGCQTQLLRYQWPGNVRELENEVERLVIMSGAEEAIDVRWLSPGIKAAEEKEPTLDFQGFQLPDAVEYIERKMILESLERTGWNKSQTARDLGVSRRNLIRKVARYELEEGTGE